jgi:hypothetical protein
MTGVPKPGRDPTLNQIFAVRGLALHVAKACSISRQAIDLAKGATTPRGHSLGHHRDASP